MSNNEVLRFMGVTKDATTAGPGKRLELFLKGCIRGIVNPCEGCFNPTSWEFGGLRKEMTVDEVVEMLDRDAWNRQVTFCGGEPLLQTRNLIKVCRELKRRDPRFHIVVYTAYVLENLLNNGINYRDRSMDSRDVSEALQVYSGGRTGEGGVHYIARPSEILELMGVIDILVDGDYQSSKRIPNEQFMNEGMFVGSSNQRIIHTQQTVNHMPHGIVFDPVLDWMKEQSQMKHCKCCGHELSIKRQAFCDDYCKARYRKRDKEMAKLGGA